MPFFKPFLIAGLLLTTAFLAGCSREPPRMKNQPTNLGSGDRKIDLPGKQKSFNAAE